MDISKIFDENPGVWVSWIQGSRVKFKILKPYEIDAINKSCKVSSVIDDQLVTATDETKFQEKYFSDIIIDWEGFEQDGKKFECNPENIKKFLDHWEIFNKFVLGTVKNLKLKSILQEAKEVKN